MSQLSVIIQNKRRNARNTIRKEYVRTLIQNMRKGFQYQPSSIENAIQSNIELKNISTKIASTAINNILSNTQHTQKIQIHFKTLGNFLLNVIAQIKCQLNKKQPKHQQINNYFIMTINLSKCIQTDQICFLINISYCNHLLDIISSYPKYAYYVQSYYKGIVILCNFAQKQLFVRQWLLAYYVLEITIVSINRLKTQCLLDQAKKLQKIFSYLLYLLIQNEIPQGFQKRVNANDQALLMIRIIGKLLKQLQQNQCTLRLVESCSSILFYNGNEKILKTFVDQKIYLSIFKIIQQFQHKCMQLNQIESVIVIVCFKIITLFVTKSNHLEQTTSFQDSQIFQTLKEYFKHCSSSLRQQLYIAVSNIYSSTSQKIHLYLFKIQFHIAMIQKLFYQDEVIMDEQKDYFFLIQTLINCFNHITNRQIVQLVIKHNMIEGLFNNLNGERQKIYIGLQLVCVILHCGQQCQQNPISRQIVSLGKHIVLQNLQDNQNRMIYQKVVYIIKTYFNYS